MGKSLDMARVNRTGRTIPTDLHVGLEVLHPETDLAAHRQTATATSLIAPLDVVRVVPTDTDGNLRETDETRET